MNRLSSLDYLRGIAAFGIMAFHYSMWTFGFAKGGDFIGKTGIYGVSVFYVLSGLTLFHVYYHKIGGPSKKGLVDFALKRVFRIFPLLWLMSIATILIEKISLPTFNILISFTGLFGVFYREDTICYGGWSVGNELIFYLFFPFFVYCSRRPRKMLLPLSLILFLVYLWFAFVHIGRARTIFDCWVDYLNPLNQVFLFLGGYLIGFLLAELRIPRAAGILLALATMLVFILYPVKDDSIYLISGFNRLAFTIMCFSLCFAFYKTDFRLPGLADKAFTVLGEISYSVYLAHPITWYVLTHFLRHYFQGMPPLARISVAIVVTLLASYTVYHFFERYFMKLGKRLSVSIEETMA
jgi:exopolysaccharide production protein ExoZ